MKSIRTKIIVAFLVVIAVMTVLLGLTIFFNFRLVNKYKEINENIVYEQSLKNDIWSLVEDGYRGIQSNDFSKYYQALDRILEIEITLNERFEKEDVNRESKLAYRGVKNSLQGVINIVEKLRRDWQESGELIGLSNNFQEAVLMSEFLKDSVTNLILAETNNISIVSQEIEKNQKFIFVLSVVVLFSVISILIIFSLIFTKRISDVIIDLSKTAEKISKGNLETEVAKHLLQRGDELGNLSNSLKKMLESLKEKIYFLDNSKEKLNKKVVEISAANTELEKTKIAMTNLLDDADILEKSLRKEKDRIKTIVSSVGEGLIVVDHSGKVTLINSTAEKFLKISKEEIIGKYIDEVIPVYCGEDKLEKKYYPIIKALKNGETVISSLGDNFYFKTSDNTKFPTIIVATPILGEGIAGAVMTFRNVTEEKVLDDAKINFISVASHQLRTPLTSIRWFSEMLNDGDAGKINKEQKDFVEHIYQATERMTSLVNLLLQIARVEAGRVRVEPVMINLKDITEKSIESQKVNLDAKKQIVKIKTIPESLPEIPMDKEVIWQVIQNLLSNACRYAPNNSVISISIVKEDKFIKYSIKDKGIGIPKQHHDKIFQKFFRADNALKAVPEGSGLGLSLVKMLVERWGGKIWFDSEENKGTTFYFTIPIEGMEAKEGEVGLGV